MIKYVLCYNSSCMEHPVLMVLHFLYRLSSKLVLDRQIKCLFQYKCYKNVKTTSRWSSFPFCVLFVTSPSCLSLITVPSCSAIFIKEFAHIRPSSIILSPLTSRIMHVPIINIISQWYFLQLGSTIDFRDVSVSIVVASLLCWRSLIGATTARHWITMSDEELLVLLYQGGEILLVRVLSDLTLIRTFDESFLNTNRRWVMTFSSNPRLCRIANHFY